MARRPHLRQCARCGATSPGGAKTCPSCGTGLVKYRFKMTPERIRLVHAVAASKGLSRTLYEDNLHAVGVNSCLEMTQSHFDEFMKRMKRLPNVRMVRAA